MSVLQRKAQVGKQEHQTRAMTVPKALRVGLAKVADDAFDMALAVIGVTKETVSASEALADIGEETLLLLLDGVRGKPGGALLGNALVSALVQQQTTGRVAATGMTDRRMTATDAALSAPLIDLMFTRAHTLIESDADRAIFPCLKFGSRAENKRLFELALEEPQYIVFRLTIDIAGGVAQSSLVLLLPSPAKQPAPQTGSEAGEVQHQKNTLETSVMDVPAELSAILCRLRFSLSQVSAFEVGTTIDIPSEAFDAVEVMSITGRLVCAGAMGHVDGNRALMLNGASGETAATGQRPSGLDDLVPEASDYSNLNLPELELPGGDTPLNPSNLDSLADLPELPDLDMTDADSASELLDLPDVDELPDLPDLPDDMPDFDDLPKLNTA